MVPIDQTASPTMPPGDVPVLHRDILDIMPLPNDVIYERVSIAMCTSASILLSVGVSLVTIVASSARQKKKHR